MQHLIPEQSVQHLPLPQESRAGKELGYGSPHLQPVLTQHTAKGERRSNRQADKQTQHPTYCFVESATSIRSACSRAAKCSSTPSESSWGTRAPGHTPSHTLSRWQLTPTTHGHTAALNCSRGDGRQWRTSTHTHRQHCVDCHSISLTPAGWDGHRSSQSQTNNLREAGLQYRPWPKPLSHEQPPQDVLGNVECK